MGFACTEELKRMNESSKATFIEQVDKFYDILIGYATDYSDKVKKEIDLLAPFSLIKEAPTFEDCLAIIEFFKSNEIKKLDLETEVLTMNIDLDKLVNSQDWKSITTVERWNRLFSSSEYPELSRLLQYVLCCPSSSAFDERIFSLINQRVGKHRPRMTTETLNGELKTLVNLKLNNEELYKLILKKPELLNQLESTEKY